ncbi:MAG: DNA alkylation repair protein [Deltaproteobacteria bacterium]|nr:DNA alkylation repair protein [Deltaproteobacteria bacterium]
MAKRIPAKVKARLDELDARIAPLCNEADRAGLMRFVPSSAIILGAKVPKLRQLAKELWLEWEKPPVEELIALMDVVCRRSHRERFLVLVFLLQRVRRFAEHEELWEAIDGWVDACVDWEMVDQLAGAVAGEFLVGAPPARVKRLLEWTASVNLWRRRFALREACRSGGSDLVFDFLVAHRGEIHRRTLTESTKKLSDRQKVALRD